MKVTYEISDADVQKWIWAWLHEHAPEAMAAPHTTAGLYVDSHRGRVTVTIEVVS